MKRFLGRAVLLAIVIGLVAFGIGFYYALTFHHVPIALWIITLVIYGVVLSMIWPRDGRGEP